MAKAQIIILEHLITASIKEDTLKIYLYVKTCRQCYCYPIAKEEVVILDDYANQQIINDIFISDASDF